MPEALRAELTLSAGSELLLHIGTNDAVTVPMDAGQRALCREALEDALTLLAQTTIALRTFAMEAATDEVWRRSSQRLSDCPEVYDLTRPSGQPVDSRAPRLRLVAADPPESDY